MYLFRTRNLLHTWSSPLMFCICYVRYKTRSSRRKERIRKVVRKRSGWGVVIIVVIRVNVGLPIIRNVIGEGMILREIIGGGGRVRLIRII